MQQTSSCGRQSNQSCLNSNGYGFNSDIMCDLHHAGLVAFENSIQQQHPRLGEPLRDLHVLAEKHLVCPLVPCQDTGSQTDSQKRVTRVEHTDILHFPREPANRNRKQPSNSGLIAYTESTVSDGCSDRGMDESSLDIFFSAAERASLGASADEGSAILEASLTKRQIAPARLTHATPTPTLDPEP